MAHDRPYAFGDIVDGHRWTIAGWERLELPELPEPSSLLTAVLAPDPVLVVTAPAPLRVIEHDDTPPWVVFELGDVAEGQRLTALGWESIEPATAVPPQRPPDDLEAEHRQVLAAYAPVVITYSPAPAAGWYPGATSLADRG